MAVISRSWMGRACESKRLSAATRAAPHARAAIVLALALLVAGASTLLAGCGRDDDRTAPASGADATPMLPGARGAHADALAGALAGPFSADAKRSGGAQRFDSDDGSPAAGASGALLPPVMHTAD